jgi:hypothetical protein
MTTELSSRFDDALAYAADLHRDRVRKGLAAIPYIAHFRARLAHRPLVTELEVAVAELQRVAP